MNVSLHRKCTKRVYEECRLWEAQNGHIRDHAYKEKASEFQQSIFHSEVSIL